MGNTCSGSSGSDPSVRKKNKEIESQMAQQRAVEEKKVKLLLLGAGESGKSTIFKQMKVIYGETYSNDERKQIVPTIFSNIISAMKVLITNAKALGLVDQVQCKEELETIAGIDDSENITVAIGDALKKLWNDPGIKATWDRRSEYQIIDSVQYYFNKIDTIKMPDYLPDKDDILYSRVRTSGIVTERYNIEETTFEMYDVGGQRNERKKWIHCFENVTAVIFVAALSEYDQALFEDASSNRMIEALTLFEDICNSNFFQKSSMILFLNKKDLFAEKIKVKNIGDNPLFKDYNGGAGSYDDGVNYFIEKFNAKNKNRDRQIYTHVTCATDTRNVKVVFELCKEIILKENLRNSGFYD